MYIVSMVKYVLDQPLWYSITFIFLSVPGALIGGQYRVRQVKDSSACSP